MVICTIFAAAHKILDVCERTPWVKHWIPTRMYKFAKFGTILARLQALPNVVVRLSSDSITGETVQGATTSTIATLDTHSTTGCGSVRSIHTGRQMRQVSCLLGQISFRRLLIGHGRTMEKQQRNIIARV